MKNRLGRGFLTLLLAFGMSSCSLTQNSSASRENTNDSSTMNQEIDLTDTGDIPYAYDNKQKIVGGEAADPFVFRWNGNYYLYPTSNGESYRAYKSHDLLVWEPVNNGVNKEGYIYEYSSDSNHPEKSTPYAPEVCYYNGYFYLTASPSGGGHYIFRSESPEGPFECISDNLEKGIDGSFFIDSDGVVHFFRASASGILGYELNDTFDGFLEEGGDDLITTYLNCTVGAWTEGPYLLKRNGAYYMTYCGTHFLSDSYRVDYSYAPAGSDITKNSAFSAQGTLAVSTESSFRGLGHSSTVLGPDLDSYFLAYHDLEAGGRYFNLSRLSFNGSTMKANGLCEEDIPGIEGPLFEGEDGSFFNEVGDFLLTEESSEGTFSCEWNNIGTGRMIFAYQSDDEYGYLDFNGSKLVVGANHNGTDTEYLSQDLPFEYRTDVTHSYRLQYRDGYLNLYFDGIEEAYDIEASYQGGKMGYAKENSFTEFEYVAMSNVARGSSDSEYYADTVSLANGYLPRLSKLSGQSGLTEVTSDSFYVQTGSQNLVLGNQGDYATYRMYAHSDNNYDIEIRVPASSLGKNIGLQIDGGDVETYTITDQEPLSKNGDSLVTLASVPLTQGTHNISLVDVGDAFEFNEMRYAPSVLENPTCNLTFNTSTDTDDYTIRNNLNLDDNGINTSSQAVCGLLTKEDCYNVILKAKMKVNSFNTDGDAGIIFSVHNYAKNYSGDGDGGDNPYTFQGLMFSLDGNYALFRQIDYGRTRILSSVPFTAEAGKSYELMVIQDDNGYECYVNNDLVMTVRTNIAYVTGKAGIYALNSDVIYSSMSIL